MFKKGYTMFVTSWENDGDYYNTIQYHVETLNEVKFCLEWLEIFTGRELPNGEYFNLGNSYAEVSGEDLQAALTYTNKLRAKYGFSPWKMDFSDEDYPDDMQFGEMAYALLGGSTDYCYRVYESTEVYYFEKDVSPLKVLE
jgi:hypothetical protein